MPTIVVDVMPKAELLDPPGGEGRRRRPRPHRTRGITAVRVGKRFEITVEGGPIDDAVKASVQQIAEEILSNQVIEDVVAIHYEQSNAELAAEAAEGATLADGFGAPAGGETH